MQLIFHDRQVLAAAPTSEAWLTVERKGTFSLSIAAVAMLNLKATDEVVLAQDLDANTWFLVPNPSSDLQAFELRPRDKSSKALMFCSQHRARAYYQAHELGQQKSVRSLVSATAVEHEGVKLYPLAPQHPTTTPAAVEVPIDRMAIIAQRLDAMRAKDEPAAQPDVTPLPTDLPQLQDEQPVVPPMVASTPAAVSGVPPLSPGQLSSSRGEQLAEYWNEREISKATPDELAEVIKVLGDMPRSDRGFTENKVLNQAKTEQAKRAKEANKKGANRG